MFRAIMLYNCTHVPSCSGEQRELHRQPINLDRRQRSRWSPRRDPEKNNLTSVRAVNLRRSRLLPVKARRLLDRRGLEGMQVFAGFPAGVGGWEVWYRRERILPDLPCCLKMSGLRTGRRSSTIQIWDLIC